MRKTISFTLLTLWLSGCITFGDDKQLYEVRLINGDSLYARSRPKLDDDGYYRFNDVNKQRYIVIDDQVLFIEKSSFKR